MSKEKKKPGQAPEASSDDELSPEELERLDRALADEPDFDLGIEDVGEPEPPASAAILGATQPADLQIQLADEPEPEELWVPVDDTEQPDVEVGLEAQEAEERGEDLWTPVDDGEEADVPLATRLDEEDEDAWGPTTTGALLQAESGRPRASVGFQLPRRPNPVPRAPAPRVLPWRGAADLVTPALADLACEADPSATTSLLLVATWEWTDAHERAIRFRLSDDGESRVWDVAVPHEPVVEGSVRLLGQEQPISLRVASDRERRGLVLGRDVLAGRFLVDAAGDDWS